MLSHRFIEAFEFAFSLHARQVRKGSQTPYLAHLMSVASIVLENGGGEDEAIAALLHDSVEDQGGEKTLQVISEKFGNVVANIVEGCSDSNVIPKPPWRGRKARYIEHIQYASPSIRLVSLSDKLHNARAILLDYRSLGEQVWDRFKGGKEGTLWYYKALVETFRSTPGSPLYLEFEKVVSELLETAHDFQTPP